MDCWQTLSMLFESKSKVQGPRSRWVDRHWTLDIGLWTKSRLSPQRRQSIDQFRLASYNRHSPRAPGLLLRAPTVQLQWPRKNLRAKEIIRALQARARLQLKLCQPV